MSDSPASFATVPVVGSPAVPISSGHNAGAPTKVGPYLVQREIGRGAMGAVYLAEHEHLGREVALKILPLHFSDTPQRIERFQREMAACGKLEHQNVVLATDAGKSNGYSYIAMQYIDGSDLAGLLDKQRRLSSGTACEIARQAAEGLQSIHENKLVHRDIKPSNIVITKDGVVKILDFGIARLREDDDGGSYTRADELMGTPDYMSPEQCLNSKDVDIRADIYSLGCTIYNTLSGHAPFSGPGYDTVAAKLAAITQDEPIPLDELCPELPSNLVALVTRMMSKDPDERPATPQQISQEVQEWADAAELEALMRGDAEKLKPVAKPKTRRRQRRNAGLQKVALRSFACVLVAGVCSLAAAFISSRRAGEIADSSRDLVALQQDSNQQITEIGVVAKSIDANTAKVASSLDKLAGQFENLGQAMEIENPQTPGEIYYNARVSEAKGNYRAARASYLEYFRVDQDKVDPHLSFVSFLKLQEGIAGAREVYRTMPGDLGLVSRRFASAMLNDPDARKEELQSLLNDEPEFAPAYFAISQSIAVGELYKQSLANQRLERESLSKFLELHGQGKLVRYYIDKSTATESVAKAEERLALLKKTPDVVIQNPVTAQMLHITGKRWMAMLTIHEPYRDIFYRFEDEEEFRSTGILPYGSVNSLTGEPHPKTSVDFIQVDSPRNMYVKYIDIDKNENGPYAIPLAGEEVRIKHAIRDLKSDPQEWIRLHKDGSLYFDLFAHWRGIREFRYGVGVETPDVQKQVPTSDYAEENSPLFYGIDVPATTEFVSAQITFTDGTKSEVVRIPRLNR